MVQSDNTDWPTEPAAIYDKAKEIYSRIDEGGEIKQKTTLAYQVLCCIQGYRERASSNDLIKHRGELSQLEFKCNAILVMSSLV